MSQFTCKSFVEHVKFDENAVHKSMFFNAYLLLHDNEMRSQRSNDFKNHATRAG